MDARELQTAARRRSATTSIKATSSRLEECVEFRAIVIRQRLPVDGDGRQSSTQSRDVRHRDVDAAEFELFESRQLLQPLQCRARQPSLIQSEGL